MCEFAATDADNIVDSFAKTEPFHVDKRGKDGILTHTDPKGDMPEDIATGISQHVAAHVPTPLAVDEHGLDSEIVEAKRNESTKEAMDMGKPENIAKNIAEGKMRKFFEENTLLGQKYVKAEKETVGQIVPDGVNVVHFIRMRVGSDSDS